jgi:hypothetical protein
LTGQQTLIARKALGVVVGATTLAVLSSPRLQHLTWPSFSRAVTAAFLLSRISLFSILFLVLGLAPRGDIPSYYWNEASNVLQGLLPYHDFVSSHAPLHSYLAALLYLTSAVSLQFVAVDGQATGIVGVLLTLALYFLAKQREPSSGASVGTAVAAIKFPPMIYVPAFLLAAPRRWR